MNMNSDNIISAPDNLFAPFFISVKSYLTVEKKKYPMVFKFKENEEADGETKNKISELVAICWRDTIKDMSEIYFSVGNGSSKTYRLKEIPYHKCNSIQMHEDFVEDPEPDIMAFGSSGEFSIALGEKLGKSRKRLTLEFSIPVFVPELNLVPKSRLSIYASINKVSDDGGETWRNRICIYSDRETLAFHDPAIIPFQWCVNIIDAFEIR